MGALPGRRGPGPGAGAWAAEAGDGERELAGLHPGGMVPRAGRVFRGETSCRARTDAYFVVLRGPVRGLTRSGLGSNARTTGFWGLGAGFWGWRGWRSCL